MKKKCAYLVASWSFLFSATLSNLFVRNQNEHTWLKRMLLVVTLGNIVYRYYILDDV